MKWDVIVVDPPWRMQAGRKLGGYQKDGEFADSGSRDSVRLPYPVMSFKEICNLNVREYAAGDCCLFLWVPNAYMDRFGKVLRAWGFSYSTVIVWEKALLGGGLGGAFGINSEYLIYAKIGKPKTNGRIKGTVHKVKRPYVNGAPKHSKKPDYFYDIIEGLTNGKRLELFARDPREGWDVWGNEVDGVELNKLI